MRASIVIPSYNEGDFLWKTVRSCLETTEGLDCEIIVADDASTDGSVEELGLRYPGVALHRHESRRGVSPTKDLGARKARGDAIVLIDGHCKPEPGAIERLVSDVEEIRGEAVVTPRVAMLDTMEWKNRPGGGYGFQFDWPSFHCFWAKRQDMAKRGRFFESPALVGCVLAVSRELYEELWGFDPDMYQYGMEDIDFGIKAWLMGYAVLNDPQARIGHLFRDGSTSYKIDFEHPYVNNIRTARKHLTDRNWDLWIEYFRSQFTADDWEKIWKIFLLRRDSVEREREYLFENRVRGEYWYSGRFKLGWPPLPESDRV